MSDRNFLKKLGKRIAGSWGRINHPKQMKAASKGIRKQGDKEIQYTRYDPPERRLELDLDKWKRWSEESQE